MLKADNAEHHPGRRDDRPTACIRRDRPPLLVAGSGARSPAAARRRARRRAGRRPPPPPPAAPRQEHDDHRSGDIADTLKASGQFTILLKALDAANLTSVLKTRRPADRPRRRPTRLQRRLPPAQLASLMKTENAAQLQALLTYHLINAAAPPTKIKGAKGPVPTVGRRRRADRRRPAPPIQVNDADVVGHAPVSNGDI